MKHRVLNAPSWTRLALAMMAAINRGHLRSPNNNSAYSGSTNLNHSPDKFAIHPDLPRPRTEGGALICMAEQLAGQFDKGRNRSFPDTYNKIWTEGSKVAEKIAINRLHALAQPSAATMAEVTAKAKEDLYTNTYTNLELNFELRAQIEDRVRTEMFNVLNKEAFENIEEWRQAYRTELIAAMRAEINPNTAPIQSNSQLIKDSEETISKEVTSPSPNRTTPLWVSPRKVPPSPTRQRPSRLHRPPPLSMAQWSKISSTTCSPGPTTSMASYPE